MQSLRSYLYKNLANAVSILGILPLCILFQPDSFAYLLPLMIYGNVMDDLDGILAGKLDIRSEFGARLDNVCDAIAHSVFALVVGMQFGGAVLAASTIGVAAIVIRSVARLDPSRATNTGSPTNELVRHLFFIIALTSIFDFAAAPFLVVAFLVNATTMLVPERLPYLTRSMTKSAAAIGGVNVALLIAWLIPITTPIVAACFFLPYLVSLAVAARRRMRAVSIPSPSPIPRTTHSPANPF